MNLSEAAARARAVSDRAAGSLAKDCAAAGAKEFLAELHVTTPVLSGALRTSERVWHVSGGGTAAVAVVGPDIIYARFRNYGGTIRSKGPWPLRNRATGQVFGRQVTQAGSHYMERAEAGAEGTMHAAMAAILSGYLDGL